MRSRCLEVCAGLQTCMLWGKVAPKDCTCCKLVHTSMLLPVCRVFSLWRWQPLIAVLQLYTFTGRAGYLFSDRSLVNPANATSVNLVKARTNTAALCLLNHFMKLATTSVSFCGFWKPTWLYITKEVKFVAFYRLLDVPFKATISLWFSRSQVHKPHSALSEPWKKHWHHLQRKCFACCATRATLMMAVASLTAACKLACSRTTLQKIPCKLNVAWVCCSCTWMTRRHSLRTGPPSTRRCPSSGSTPNLQTSMSMMGSCQVSTFHSRCHHFWQQGLHGGLICRCTASGRSCDPESRHN